MSEFTCPTCGHRSEDAEEMIEHRVSSHPSSSSDESGAAPTAPPPEASSPEKKGLPVAGIAVGVVLLALAVGAALYFLVLKGDDSQTITGKVGLTDIDGDWTEGEPCSGSGGYEDLREGARVTVADGGGETIAVGRVDDSKAENEFGCLLSFTVEDVPSSDFYDIEVASRGGLKYSHQELEDDEWDVFLTIGDGL